MIICTNPPFSLFREFVKQLVKYNKKFLIIGSMNAISYKEVFPLIKDNKLWYGTTQRTGQMWFKIPNDAPYKSGQKEENGIRYQSVGPIVWFTNLNVEYRNKPQELFLSYERRDREYPKYDNYDAIEVSKAIEVPRDFLGVMGVPITWLKYYCPEQFDIITMAGRGQYTYYKKEMLKCGFNEQIESNGGKGIPVLNGKPTYTRILIRRKQ